VLELMTCRGAGTARSLKKFWVIALCMGLPLGIYQAWTAVLYLNLEGFITQDEAGWLGFWMTVSGCAGSIVVGAALDRLKGYLKTATAGLMLLSTLGFLAFSFCVAGTFSFPHETVVVLAYASGIWGGFFFNCSIPLFFEMTMEVIFGWCPDSAATPVLIFVNTVVQIVFLALPTKIAGSALWMNWLTVGTFVLCALPVVLLRMDYARSDFDAASPQHEDGKLQRLGTSVASRFDDLGCL